uniref:Uncharacterized protein n=1 Tax=Mus musculus TaxID=10090 RepID=Q3UEY2_MOUSE|nr:unnamed protein product [Mus musculus]
MVKKLRGGQHLPTQLPQLLLDGLGILQGIQVLDGTAKLSQHRPVVGREKSAHEHGEELKDFILRGFIWVAPGALHTQDAGTHLIQNIVIVVVFLPEHLQHHGLGHCLPALTHHAPKHSRNYLEKKRERGCSFRNYGGWGWGRSVGWGVAFQASIKPPRFISRVIHRLF